jgi:hypothetical protein
MRRRRTTKVAVRAANYCEKDDVVHQFYFNSKKYIKGKTVRSCHASLLTNL